MDRWQSRTLIALAMAMVTFAGAQATRVAPPATEVAATQEAPASTSPATEVAATQEAPASTPKKPLALLTKDKGLEIDHVEIKGENPALIYIPIVHDNPEHRHAAGGTTAIEETLVRCRTISEHLYKEYGVRSILLEGISKTLADKYNSPKYRGRKLSVGDSKSTTFKVWFDLLNENQWNLVPAYEKNTYGPLTQLGYEYTIRLQKAFGTAKQNGWFTSRQAFVDNQTEFTALINKAAEGYNDRLDALLKEDPGLKKEYDITVIQRNKLFIDNSLAAKGPTVIMCGGGHIQDLIDQLDNRKTPYMIIVPKGIAWPPARKDDKAIYDDMLKLGCQLKSCDLQFGDGTGANVKIPIK